MSTIFVQEKGLCKVVNTPSNNPFMISPFGIFCTACNSPFLDSNGIQKMKQLKNHQGKHTTKKLMKFTATIDLMNSVNEALYTVKQDLDVTKFLKNTIDKPINAYSCLNCDFFSHNKANMEKHSSTKNHNFELKDHYKSNCGRLVPIDILVSQNEKAHGYDIIKGNNKTASPKVVSSFIKQYLPRNEFTDIYIPIFTVLIKHFGNNINKTKQFLEQYSNILHKEPSEIPLTIMNEESRDFLEFFLKGCIWWIDNRAYQETNLLNAQIRGRLLKFDYNDNEGISTQNGFNVRKSNTQTVIQIKKMITVIFLFDSTQFSKSDFTNEREYVIQMSKNHYNEYRKDKSRLAHIYEDMATNSCLFQRLLLCVLKQKQQSSLDLVLGIVVAICSMLTVKKVKNEPDVTQFRTVASMSSIFSTQLYIYRLATASVICNTDQSNEKAIDDLIHWFRVSHVTNTICPLIKKCRNEDSKKISSMKSTINPSTGDIMIKEYKFPKNLWELMIPTLYDKLVASFEKSFIGQEWKEVLDLSKKIKIDGMEDGVLTEKIDFFLFDNVNDRSKQINKASANINLRPQIHDNVINQISALMVIVLSCCGGGATRHTEIDNLCLNRCSYKNECVYYVVESIKKGNATSSNPLGKGIPHKLSMEMSRLFLLYCILGKKWKADTHEYISHIIFNSNKNQLDRCEKYNVISNTLKRNILKFHKEYFNIETLFNDLGVLRQFYSSLGNAIFSINEETSCSVLEQYVSTSDNVASLHGHTKRTHDLHYSSKLPLEIVYEQYHIGLGSKSYSSSQYPSLNDTRTPFQPIDIDELLFNLHSIYGFGENNSGFLCNEQKMMVLDSTNNYQSHSLYNVGCGKGKSLTWLLPSFSRTRLNQKSKCTIVILPYKFLLHHHHSHVLQTLTNHNILDVSSYSRDDLDIDSIPTFLSEDSNLPHILFLTVDAFHFICNRYIFRLRQIIELGYVNKIIWDECHTIFTETNFRFSYDSIRQYLCSFDQVPVICMSGTFPSIYMEHFCKYLTRKDSPVVASPFDGLFKVIQDDDPLGSPKVEIVVNIYQESNRIDGYCEMATTFIKNYSENHKDSRIHVIASTKEEATNLESLLISDLVVKKDEISVATSDITKNLVKDIADKWSKNLLKILITTTLGLVGNECSQNHCVVVIGLLYDILSVIQSIGRIRPHRRKMHSTFQIFLPNETILKRILNQRRRDELKKFQLLSENKLITMNFEEFNKILSSESVYEWCCKDLDCRYQSLHERMKFSNLPGPCNMCDNCNTKVNSNMMNYIHVPNYTPILTQTTTCTDNTSVTNTYEDEDMIETLDYCTPSKDTHHSKRNESLNCITPVINPHQQKHNKAINSIVPVKKPYPPKHNKELNSTTPVRNPYAPKLNETSNNHTPVINPYQKTSKECFNNGIVATKYSNTNNVGNNLNYNNKNNYNNNVNNKQKRKSPLIDCIHFRKKRRVSSFVSHHEPVNKDKQLLSEFIDALQTKCFICGISDCRGDACYKGNKQKLNGCFKCGGRHKAGLCTNRVSIDNVLFGKACYSCYFPFDFNGENHSHDPKLCGWRKHLKMIFMNYIKHSKNSNRTTMLSFLKDIYKDDPSLELFLLQKAKEYMNQPRTSQK